MSDNTHISWANATWNIATGCTKVSPGCKGCYMFREYPRLKRMGLASYQKSPDVVTLVPGLMDQPLRWKKPRRIFPCSMSDICHEDIPDSYFYTALAVAALAPQHQFLFLTKRADRMMKLFLAGPQPVEEQILKHLAQWPLTKQQLANISHRLAAWNSLIPWPLPNVWPGVSVENEDYIWRLDCLWEIPAWVRWLSYEPALGPLYLRKYLECPSCHTYDCGRAVLNNRCLDWVVYGGESGREPRALNPHWFRQVRDECIAAGVPQHFKQWGENIGVDLIERFDPHLPTGEEGRVWRASSGRFVETSQKPTWLDDEHGFVKIGKHVAGRLLDGRTWDEHPDPQAQGLRIPVSGVIA